MRGRRLKTQLEVTHYEARKTDNVISAVVDIIVELTDWDPESIFPEYTLRGNLQMSDEVVELFFSRLANRLLSNKQINVTNLGKMNLREIVGFVHGQLEQKAA